MARIPYADEQEMSEAQEKVAAALGGLNIGRMLAHAPTVAKEFSRFGGAILFKSNIDARLRELAIIRVGLLAGAAYEVHQHDAIGLKVGLSEDQVAAIRTGPDADIWTDLESLVLRYTDEVVTDVKASDKTFAAALEALGEEQLVELTLTIGYYMLVSRFLETFEVDIEEAGSQKGLSGFDGQ